MTLRKRQRQETDYIIRETLRVTERKRHSERKSYGEIQRAREIREKKRQNDREAAR